VHGLRVILTGGNEVYALEKELGDPPAMDTPTNELNIINTAFGSVYTGVARIILLVFPLAFFDS
jgi:hypothetical protein